MTSDDHLHLIPPALAERALRASGMGVGNRIPGTLVLRDELTQYGWNVHELFDVVHALQRLAERSTVGGPLFVLRAVEAGTTIYHSTGGSDTICLCLLCRIRRMWLEQWCEMTEEI